MSDRVIFGSTNDTDTPANSSGFCGFPRPLKTGATTGGGTAYPIAMSLAQTIELYWRVKTFYATTDLSVTNSAMMTQSGGTGILSITAGPTTELDHINGFTTVRSNPIMGVTGPFEINFDDPNYYPSLRVTGLISVSDFMGSSMQISIDSATVTGSSIIGSINGFSLPIYYTVTDSDGGGSYTFTRLDITYNDFWPYKGNDGNPIYNTSTGAELQDPTH